MNERRQDERFFPKQIGLPVLLKPLVPGRAPMPGELIDVSSGGLALWTSKPMETNSHWTLVVPDAPAGVPVKMIRTRPGFGGHIHAFKFSSLQPGLADKLTGKATKPPRPRL